MSRPFDMKTLPILATSQVLEGGVEGACTASNLQLFGHLTYFPAAG